MLIVTLLRNDTNRKHVQACRDIFRHATRPVGPQRGRDAQLPVTTKMRVFIPINCDSRGYRKLPQFSRKSFKVFFSLSLSLSLSLWARVIDIPCCLYYGRHSASCYGIDVRRLEKGSYCEILNLTKPGERQRENRCTRTILETRRAHFYSFSLAFCLPAAW